MTNDVIIEKGKTYKAHNQGMNITPQTIDVHVVSVSETDVYYRKENSPIVHQTSLERFIEIVYGKKNSESGVIVEQIQAGRR